VRRAKLYYLRDRVGKRARVRERRYTGPEVAVEPGLLAQDARVEHEQATDSDGMTAEEAVAEGNPDLQIAEGNGEGQAGAGGEGEALAQDGDGAELQSTPETEASAPAEPDDPSSDAGDAHGGDAAGDKPA
jgi:large subunit ribosomal protein L19